MRGTKAKLLPPALLLLVIWLASAGAACAADSKALADYLITKTVHPGGVIVLPRCGDGQLFTRNPQHIT